VTTNFPSSIDNFTNPTTSDTMASPSHSAQHADVNDAVEAIETALLDGAPLHIDDANERVGIGTTTPNVALEVSSNAPLVYITDNDNLLSDNAHSAGLLFRDSANSLSGGIGYLSGSNQDMDIGTWTPNGRLDFHTGSGATQMSITSSGNVGIGTTSPSQKLQVQGNILVNGDLLIEGYTNPSQPAGNIHSYASSSRSAWSSAATSDGSTRYHMRFASPSYPTCGWIYTRNGNVYYVNNSDYRLKENIVPLTGASERVMQLQPCTFNRINSPGVVDEGFIAHEVQAVVPTAICGDKDEVDEEGNPVYQGIDQSKMIPLLTAALQEALTTIDQLTARIEALEAS